MLIHDSIYSWEGWGGKLKLASGKCRLRIFDRRKSGEPVTILRPYVVVVSDVAESKMSIRSCAGHIATKIVHEFNIAPQRMMYVEFYPAIQYGRHNEYQIAEQYVAVDFTWKENRALHPKWRQLNAPILDVVKNLMTAMETDEKC
ncbi:MAG: hypothetical protein ACQERN_05595 [Thermodesulfobacteriota bacterium]